MKSFLRFVAVLVLVVACSAQPLVSGGTQDAPQRTEDPKAQTVYITRTGKRYHRDGCRYLASSKIPSTLKDAKARGYTPCKVCRPPQ